MVQQFAQQRQFMLVLVAFGVVQQDTTAQAEDADELEQGKTAAGFLGAGLRISPLVLRSVGQRHGGAVDDFGPQAIPEFLRLGQELLGLGGDGMANALEPLQGQAQAGLAIAAGGFIDRLCRVEAKEGLNLPDHFPAGAAGIEDLIEKAPEGAPERVNALAAVGAFVGLRQKSRRDESGEEFFEQQKALLAQGLEAPAEGGQAGAPGWE